MSRTRRRTSARALCARAREAAQTRKTGLSPRARVCARTIRAGLAAESHVGVKEGVRERLPGWRSGRNCPGPAFRAPVASGSSWTGPLVSNDWPPLPCSRFPFPVSRPPLRRGGTGGKGFRDSSGDFGKSREFTSGTIRRAIATLRCTRTCPLQLGRAGLGTSVRCAAWGRRPGAHVPRQRPHPA